MAFQKLTEYECKRLENIKRNEEMLAALKIHSTSATLSVATKRQRTKTYKVSTEETQEAKTEAPSVIRRSLRTRGMPPDSKGLADDFCENFDKTPTSVSPLKPQSPRVLGPIAMKDAFSGDEIESNQVLVGMILSIAKKTQVDVSCKEEFNGVKDIKDENFSEKTTLGSCKSEASESSVKKEFDENLIGKRKSFKCVVK
ncbi:hypothetical protein V6N11_081952 [Hibiscus sabdariffa]|uniref:Uncharacterized protein n=1 Tax=Hibiscus sabdariffa TaxID=183260 RepID=A0ABR2Q7Q5_9ROSI